MVPCWKRCVETRLTRGNGLRARRRRGAQPRFIQQASSEELLLLDGVIADLVSLLNDPLDHKLVSGDTAADEKEGGLRTMGRQDIDDLGSRLRIGAVVDSQRDEGLRRFDVVEHLRREDAGELLGRDALRDNPAGSRAAAMLYI